MFRAIREKFQRISVGEGVWRHFWLRLEQVQRNKGMHRLDKRFLTSNGQGIISMRWNQTDNGRRQITDLYAYVNTLAFNLNEMERISRVLTKLYHHLAFNRFHLTADKGAKSEAGRPESSLLQYHRWVLRMSEPTVISMEVAIIHGTIDVLWRESQ